MAREDKVIWSEGMFLQPQHFQQHDRYVENLLESRVGPAAPHGWGFSRLALDESALTLGRLALSSAAGIFPDGTPFDFPATHAGPLPLEVPPAARDQLILLTVPLRRAHAREAQLAPGEESGLERYAVAESEVADSTADGSALI